MKHLLAILILACTTAALALDLPTIPAPVTTATNAFASEWIVSLSIIADSGRVSYITQPYDGWRLLQVPTVQRSGNTATDPDLAVLVPAALAVAQRLAQQSATPYCLTVNAPHTTRLDAEGHEVRAPIQIVALFRTADPRVSLPYTIPDAMAAAATDPGVAGVTAGLCAWVATKSGADPESAPMKAAATTLAQVKAAIIAAQSPPP